MYQAWQRLLLLEMKPQWICFGEKVPNQALHHLIIHSFLEWKMVSVSVVYWPLSNPIMDYGMFNRLSKVFSKNSSGRRKV